MDDLHERYKQASSEAQAYFLAIVKKNLTSQQFKDYLELNERLEREEAGRKRNEYHGSHMRGFK